MVDENGQPAAGAQVRYASHPVEGSTTVTAADGRFRLPLINEFSEVPFTSPLIAESQDHARIGYLDPSAGKPRLDNITSKPPAAPLRIVLKPARTIHVSVKNSDGQPVSGALVEALGFGVSIPGATEAPVTDVLQVLDPLGYGVSFRGVTDQQGRAAIRLASEAEILQIIALKDDAGFDYYENYRSWPPNNYRTWPPSGPDPPPDTVSLTLAKPHRIRVRTVDSAGKPVAGVFVGIWTFRLPGKLASYCNSAGSSLGGQRSGPSGTCDFSWLPAAADSREIRFELCAKGYSCPDLSQMYFQQPVGPVTLRLLKDGEISGCVRFPDGKPAAGIIILAEGRGATYMNFGGRTRTKADGTYTLAICPNQFDDRRRGRPRLGRAQPYGGPTRRGRESRASRLRAGQRNEDPRTRDGPGAETGRRRDGLPY